MIEKLAKKIRPTVGTCWLGRKIEAKFIDKAPSNIPPPIFIVGLPRSGSTLLYQILTEHFETTFFSNFSSVFITYPAIMAYLTKTFQNSAQIQAYESDYGLTPGLFSPSEAGGIFRYWMSLNVIKRSRLIKDTLNKIASVYNRPFVLKNLNLSSEISLLNQIFPSALFIRIDRNIPYVIQSIYQKIKKGGSIDVAGFEQINKNGEIIKSITREVVVLDDKIKEDLIKEHVNSIVVQYEGLCNNFEEEIIKLEKSYASSGYTLKRNTEAKLANLITHNNIKLNPKDWDLILDYLRAFYTRSKGI